MNTQIDDLFNEFFICLIFPNCGLKTSMSKTWNGTLVDNIGTAIVQVADEKKKEVLTEISNKFAVKFIQHDSIQNENYTVETLHSNNCNQ
jgi:hypothetical protein